MQPETTIRYHFWHIRLPKIQSWLHTLWVRLAGKTYALIYCWWEGRYNHDGIWGKALLPFDLAISITGIRPQIHWYKCKKTYVRYSFLARDKMLDTMQNLPVGGWLKKPRNISHTIEYRVALKIRELSLCATRQWYPGNSVRKQQERKYTPI